MAGGPSTVELAQAVSDAGGLGFLAAGYRGAEALREDIRSMRGRPFGVNLFVPGSAEVDERALAAYVRSLGPEAGEPRFDDDGWRQKLDVLRDGEPVPVVSFTFGCPPLCEVASLRAHGSEVWVTVTSAGEARAARDAGADVLVVQGVEAGGHQGSWVDRDFERLQLLALLRVVAGEVDLPLVATGGVSDAAGVARLPGRLERRPCRPARRSCSRPRPAPTPPTARRSCPTRPPPSRARSPGGWREGS